MKFKILGILSAAVLIIALAGLTTSTTGCKTITNLIGTNTTQIQSDVMSAATQATTYALNQDAKSRIYFVAATDVLGSFVNSTNSNPASIAAALAALPISQLQSPEAQLAITAILGVYDITYASYVQNAVDQNGMANAVLNGLVQGINAGLAAVPAPVASASTIASLTNLKSPYMIIKPGLVPQQKKK
jgi:hypothetical protein